MKIKIIIAYIILCFSTISCSHAQETEFSKKALEEKIIATDGNFIAFQNVLNQYKGKTLVIEFWASWCGDCVKAMPKIKELQKNNSEVSYVFISLDKTINKWKDGIEKHQIKGDHYLANNGMNGSFGKAIDLDWIPRYIIIDKTGKIIIYRAIETDFEKINTTLKSIK
ncbi:TlpA family protein disulfide reductase [Flavobacterium luteum]|uniref:TlpA family protein disulfide reductase n=1 Tax=Flavobacterium luteum TaxID=2026654 RepID=A0A7J5AKT3_9FLAO|nr:TlpA disulfide reductase family protein [Flavobacterium luteum]KAB1158155.1 TlpA family protein disulfide reductase [Flavobacterium luteum]